MDDNLPVQRSAGAAHKKEVQNQFQQQTQANLTSQENLERLNKNINTIYKFLNQQHIEELGNIPVKNVVFSDDESKYITMYKINKIMYNEKEDSYEKLISVFSALHSFVSGINMIIHSDGKEIGLYLCTLANEQDGTAGRLLESNIKGQFPGSEMERIDDAKREDFFSRTCGFNHNKIIKSVSIIPGKRAEEINRQRDFSAQGFEKFIDSLNGKKYTLFVVSQRVPSFVIEDYKSGLENISTLLSPYAKESVSYAYNKSNTISYNYSENFSNGINESISKSFGTSHTNGISQGTNDSKNTGMNFFGFSSGNSRGTNYGTNSQDGVNRNETTVSGTVFSIGGGKTVGDSETISETNTLNVTRDNKAVLNLMETIDKHLKRIEENRVFGMWNCSCYIISEDIETASISSNTLKSLLLGDDTISAEAYCNQWAISMDNGMMNILNYIKYLRHPEFDYNLNQISDRLINQIVTPALMVSGKELPTIMSFPRKSVPGVAVSKMAEFARNVPSEWQNRIKRSIKFGKIRHMGKDDTNEIQLDIDTFSSHCFITGASGSGKSNTTYNILKELCRNGIKFLVIEPAKGEYKKIFGNYLGIKPNILTTNPKQCRMLKINPFEFHEKVHILEHINRLINTISACWPLYGPMPAMLKQAFESAYIKCGWDLNHSVQVVANDKIFPDFHDLEEVMTDILEKSEYSAQAKGDYKGALLTRISSMTSGFEGQIFCENRGVSDKCLFDENCVVDLSNIGSQETKALIMGILIIRLREYRYVMAKSASEPTKHVTILEEAHNLLKRCSHEQSQDSGNILGSSVEMLTESIAEMRTYGEGFMIIDQSPGAVDITAIKNTAIKIIHRLPEKEDCEEIGNALSLDEEQIRELSRLETGVAAVFHAGWIDTVLARMGEKWDNSQNISINDKVRISLNAKKYADGSLITPKEKEIIYTVKNIILENERKKFLLETNKSNCKWIYYNNKTENDNGDNIEKEIKEVKRDELLKLRGIIIDFMYEQYKNNKFNEDTEHKILEKIHNLCESGDFESLKDGKKEELIGLIQNFFINNDEIIINYDYNNLKSKKMLERVILAFMIYFFQLTDLFRLIQFPNQFSKSKEFENAPATGKSAVAINWANETIKNMLIDLNEYITQYIILPNNKYFNEICSGIICEYGKRIGKQDKNFLKAWEKIEEENYIMSIFKN